MVVHKKNLHCTEMMFLLAIVFTPSFCSCRANDFLEEEVSASCTSTEYFCPQKRTCLPSIQRCTPDEVCPYEGELDKCLKVYPRDPSAYAILIGHVKIYDNPIPEIFGLEHQFLQYRGFTYESDYGVIVHDLNSPQYIYRDKKRGDPEKYPTVEFTRRGITQVGYSYCTYEEVGVFNGMWDRLRFNRFTLNCQHYVKALKTFLTTDKCIIPRTKNESFICSARKSAGDIIARYLTCSTERFTFCCN